MLYIDHSLSIYIYIYIWRHPILEKKESIYIRVGHSGFACTDVVGKQTASVYPSHRSHLRNEMSSRIN